MAGCCLPLSSRWSVAEEPVEEPDAQGRLSFPSAALGGARLLSVTALPGLIAGHLPTLGLILINHLPPRHQGSSVTQASPYLVQDPCKCVSGDPCPLLPLALSTFNLVF